MEPLRFCPDDKIIEVYLIFFIYSKITMMIKLFILFQKDRYFFRKKLLKKNWVCSTKGIHLGNMHFLLASLVIVLFSVKDLLESTKLKESYFYPLLKIPQKNFKNFMKSKMK